jgi:hypothetical protein
MTVEVVQAIGLFIVVPICIVVFFVSMMYFTIRRM